MVADVNLVLEQILHLVYGCWDGGSRDIGRGGQKGLSQNREVEASRLLIYSYVSHIVTYATGVTK